jgi:hypothetical protein
VAPIQEINEPRSQAPLLVSDHFARASLGLSPVLRRLSYLQQRLRRRRDLLTRQTHFGYSLEPQIRLCNCVPVNSQARKLRSEDLNHIKATRCLLVHNAALLCTTSSVKSAEDPQHQQLQPFYRVQGR